MCLVDPYRRIVSTANVPPQQEDWFKGLPKEAVDKPPEGLMPREEALEHKEKLTDERTLRTWIGDSIGTDGWPYLF